MPTVFNSLKLCLLLVILSFGGSSRPAYAARPLWDLLGTTLPDALKTDFFTWFHLQEIEREKDSVKRTVIVFKPSGEAFRKLVTLRTTLDVNDKLVQMDLYLARSFINDRNKRAFANDIAKSFLLSGPPRPDRIALKVLTDEIGSEKGTDTQILTGQPLPETPIKESSGYLTYLGKRYVYTQELSSSKLRLENTKQNDEDWLLIQLSLRQ